MSEPTISPVRKPRLNPFAFPSDTTLRFVLLVIFVVCGSGQLYGNFHTDRPADQAVREWVSKAWSGLSTLNPAEVNRYAAIIERDVLPLLAQCMALLRPPQIWKISGICLTLVVGALLYWFYPIWKLRTGCLEHIRSSELPDVQHELRSIAEAAGLVNPPVFVWNPLASGLPVAFGRHGRHHVALSGSFITQYFYSDKRTFRAIILHELAHIRNGDVYKTYFTISLWLAFLITSIAPSGLISL